MNVFRHLFIIAVLACLPLSQGISQPFGDGPASEKIKQLRQVKLIEALDLDEEQSVRLFAREKEFRKNQKILVENRKSAIEALHSLIKEGAEDAALYEAIEKVHLIDEQFISSRYEFARSLNDILSAEQIARMVVFEHKFMHEIKEILQSLRDNRPAHKRRK